MTQEKFIPKAHLCKGDKSRQLHLWSYLDSLQLPRGPPTFQLFLLLPFLWAEPMQTFGFRKFLRLVSLIQFLPIPCPQKDTVYFQACLFRDLIDLIVPPLAYFHIRPSPSVRSRSFLPCYPNNFISPLEKKFQTNKVQKKKSYLQ